jgi:hypothetical protein
MGDLTTFTIYNDNCQEILDNPKEFAEKIYNACVNNNSNKANEIIIGNNCQIKCQKPRHSHEETIYVHAGNTVCEINPTSQEMIKLINNNHNFFKEILNHLIYIVKILKKLYKENYNKK